MDQGNWGLQNNMESHGWYGEQPDIPNIWGAPNRLQTPASHASRLPLGPMPMVPSFGASAKLHTGLAQNSVMDDPVKMGNNADIPVPPDMKKEDEIVVEKGMPNQGLFAAAAIIVGAAFLL